MKKYVLGIDGGGTKSHLAIFCETGQFVGMFEHGTLNHECMDNSFEQMEDELNYFITESLKSLNLTLTDISYAVFGLAGVDTPAQHKLVHTMLTKIGFKNFDLVNDAYLGVYAVAPNNYGICAINGTGSTLAAVDKSDNQKQVGGIGDISDDYGGSSCYGTKLIGAVYNSLFRCHEETLLTPLLLDAIGAKSAEDFVECVTVGLDNGTIRVENLNKLLFIAADNGDDTALKLLQLSAISYGGSIKYLAQSMNFPADEELHVALVGSVFVKEKSTILPTLIKEYVAKNIPERNFVFHTLTAPPVSGAIILALKKQNITVDKQVIWNACINGISK